MRRAAVKPKINLYRNLAESLRKRRGVPRNLLAFFYGAFAALAYSPADIVPVMWISFPALIFLLQGAKNSWRAFFCGWSFALGFFVFDLYWTAASMFVDIGHFWWVVPFALFGLPAAFAVYYGLAAALARKMGLRGIRGAITFALLWFLADYARGHLFTGFPWNIEGYIWADFPPVIQLASVTGIYGLTLLTLIAACLPAALGEENDPLRNRAIMLSSAVALAAIIVWGSMRLADASHDMVPDVRLRLVQPNVEQRMKWANDLRERNFGRILEQSSQPAEKPVTDIFWPETAATFFLAEDPVHRDKIAAIVPPGGALITGVLRREINPLNEIEFYNSLIAINHASQITAVYDKAHLVPFGEYVPFREWFPMQALAGLGIDFSHGPGPKSLHVAGLPPFSTLICYEAIFPDGITDPGDPPQFLLNVTNDAWYGHTAGPYQHFAIARVRAVEQGLPLIRVANTGISGIIDPYGRVVARLRLGERGIIDGDLPKPLSSPTYFSRTGEKTLWLIFGVFAFAVLLEKFKVKSR